MARWLPHWSSSTHRWYTAGFVVGATILYWLSRLTHLTALPVFADEAIYIRWAQLITHDSAYLFFGLNDGKPPLFMWLLIPFLSAFADPLVAGRLLSAVCGYAQLWVNDALVRWFGGTWPARLSAAVIGIIAPFWFFSHRLAVMDALLTLLLSATFLGLLWIHRVLSQSTTSRTTVTLGLALLWTGSTWGAALWTKTPGLFLAPVFIGAAYFLPLFNEVPFRWQTWNKTLRTPSWWLQRSAAYGAAGALGLGIFLLLKLHPAFGSLFGRSSDFSYSVSEVITSNGLIVWNNVRRVLPWLATYLRPELLSFSLIAALVSRMRTRHWWLLGAGLVWMAPLLIIGKTLHSRYFLPVSVFITVSGALFWQEVWQFLEKQKDALLPQLTFAALSIFFIIGSLRFMLLAQFDTARTPLVIHDREQYLMDWSSGYGIPEVRDRVIQTVQDGQRVTVVTEGSFGTLPDGLLLYFDNRPEIQHIRIDGLAQYPVKTLPDWVLQDAADHPTWLVVNENRLELAPEFQNRVRELDRYPRPYGAPPLLLLEVLPNQEQL